MRQLDWFPKGFLLDNIVVFVFLMVFSQKKTLCLSLLVNEGVLRAHLSLLKTQVIGNELRSQIFLLACQSNVKACRKN